MVGYDEERNVLLSNSFAAGVLGGIVTRTLVSPLDVLKIRFQLQPEKLSSQLKYTGIFQAVETIWKEEGVLAFWKGYVPAQFLSMIYGGMQFGSFQYFTKAAHNLLPHKRDDHIARAAIHCGCGSLSGGVATLCSQPVDVLRTRFAAQKEPKVYTSLFSATRMMYRSEGLRCFYKGLTPALAQVMPYTGLQFASYSLLEAVWRRSTLSEGAISHLVCGSGAGIISKLVVYPFDVVKKRLQVQGFNKGTVSEVVHYSGFGNCVYTIATREGAKGFYKGLSAAILKSCATSGLIFFTYEWFSEALTTWS